MRVLRTLGPRLAGCLVLVPFLLAPPTAVAKDDPGLFARRAWSHVELGKTFRKDQLIVIPLVADTAPEPLAVKPDLRTADLILGEPDWPVRRYDLRVADTGPKPVLLFGGAVLVGGKMDRLFPQDVLVPAGSFLEMHTLPAAMLAERRTQPLAFQFSQAVAPAYLREKALFDPSQRLVRVFLSHFLDFRNPGDDRESLAAIDESHVLVRYCIACQQEMSGIPDAANHRVVGFVTVVRGRLQSVELFGTNELFSAYFAPLLRAHAYEAAAVELRAKQLGLPLPDDADPDATIRNARRMAQDLLTKIKNATYRVGEQPEGSVGEAVLLRAGTARGGAIGWNRRLVHAVVFPYDPFEEALYGHEVEPEPVPGEPNHPGVAELERRAANGGRLSEWEQRLLERLRTRRGLLGH
jgi:ARG and Rhodanese-Phosphatase-superfamily-associated Protein domain